MKERHDPCVRESRIHDESLFEIWEAAASLSWESYALYGRGLVRAQLTLRYDYDLDRERCEAELEYQPKPHCAECAKLLEAYDPATQIVVVITSENRDRKDETTHHLAEGWPPPPDAEALTPDEHRLSPRH